MINIVGSLNDATIGNDIQEDCKSKFWQFLDIELPKKRKLLIFLNPFSNNGRAARQWRKAKSIIDKVININMFYYFNIGIHWTRFHWNSKSTTCIWICQWRRFRWVKFDITILLDMMALFHEVEMDWSMKSSMD